MKMYIIVEGKCTEFKIYPSWIHFVAPSLKRVHNFDEIKENSYYLVSGYGLPSLISNHLPNAIQDIARCGCYDHLVVGLDAEELTVQQRINEVYGVFEQYSDMLKGVKLKVIVQNRCIESWLLANREIFVDNPTRRKLKNYVKFYNVKYRDPEKMPAFKAKKRGSMPKFSTIARFHTDYLQEIFKERDMFYAKRNPKYATRREFFNDLVSRLNDHPEQLETFKEFVDFFRSVHIES